MTGTLGDSAAGVALIIERVERRKDPRARHSRNVSIGPCRASPPGSRCGRSRAPRSTCRTDLLADLGHICASSGVRRADRRRARAAVGGAHVAVPAADALAHALAGGDDYELCFTAPPSRAEEIEAALEATGTLVRRARPARRRGRRSHAGATASRTSRRRAAIATSDASRLPLGTLRDPVNFVAFGFGTGLAPRAPGTFGSVARALPGLVVLHICRSVARRDRARWSRLGVWVCGESARRLGVHDHRRIVFDEIAGVFATALAVPERTILWFALVFVFFRIFDILKPWPIRDVDHRMRGGARNYP